MSLPRSISEIVRSRDASDGPDGEPIGIDTVHGNCQIRHVLTVELKPDGRVLVPAALRREFGVSPGEPLVAHVEEGRLVLERRADVLRRAQERFAKLETSDSLVDELLADRRAEVAREG